MKKYTQIKLEKNLEQVLKKKGFFYINFYLFRKYHHIQKKLNLSKYNSVNEKKN